MPKRKAEDKLVDEPPAKKKFRLKAKKLFLTYPRCDFTKQKIHDELQKKVGIQDYYIVQEEHKDGGQHIHAFLELIDKPDIRNCRFFDIDGHHPNIMKASRNIIHNYMKKFDHFPLTNIPDGYVQLAIDGQIEAATKLFIEQHPKDYVIHKPRIDQNLLALSRKKRTEHIFPLNTDYDPKWDETKSLLFVGNPGVGKTEFMKSWLTKRGMSYLRATHIDALKRYSGQDVILWDDVSFCHLPRETVIHITETTNEREIHCRHTVAYIPPGVKNIFLSNHENIFPPDHTGAIDRRVQVQVLPPSLILF